MYLPLGDYRLFVKEAIFVMDIETYVFLFMNRMHRFIGGRKKNQLDESIKTGERSIWESKPSRRVALSGEASPKKGELSP